MSCDLLNVKLFENYFDEELSQQFFNSFSHLNFERCEFNLFGTNVKGSRKVCALSDHNLSYTFANQTIYGMPWTAEGVKLRHRIFKFTGYTYNFALLELYDDGENYFPMHRKNGSCLNPHFEFCLINFGAPRTIQFEREHDLNIDICMGSGSILKIPFSTNLKFKQAVVTDATVTTPSITVLFMNVMQSQPPYYNVEPDWMHFRYAGTKERTISTHMFATCWTVSTKELNGIFFIDIRAVHERASGELLPTKNGIAISTSDFFAIGKKIENYPCISVENTLANHIIMMWAGDKLLLQKLNVDSNVNLTLNFNYIRLWPSQLMSLCEKLEQIQETIIIDFWENYIPRIFSKYYNEDNVIACDNESIMKAFKITLEYCVFEVIQKMNRCLECEQIGDAQLSHTCNQLSKRQQYEKIGKFAFALIDAEQFTKMLCKSRIISMEYLQSTNVVELNNSLFF